MISTFASGIVTGTLGVENFLSSPNSQGKYVLQVDLSGMVTGTYVELRRYKMVIAGGTARVIDVQTFQGVQPSDLLIAVSEPVWNSLTDTNAVRFSLKQTVGTVCTYPWSVLLEDSLAPAVSGRTLDVASAGTVGITTGTFIDAMVDKVWDEQISGHLSAGSTGEKLNSASSGGDPWGTALPGAYVPGQAGYILASRMPTGTVIVGVNNDKSGYSLSSPQNFDLIGNVSGTISSVLNVINPVTAGNVTGSVFGNVNGSVNNVIQSVGISTGTFIDAIADQVWDELIVGHLNPGSTGEKLNSAASGGDPWGTALPGTYIPGQAGYILASRMPTGTVIVGVNNDKTGYSLSSPQTFNLIGNVSGTMSNVINVINPVTAGNVTGSVLGNVDGSVGSVTDINSTLGNKIADFVLRRSFANARVSANGDAFSFRSLLGAIAKLVNRWNITASTLTIYAEDDTTSIGTQTLTGDATADPIVQINTD